MCEHKSDIFCYEVPCPSPTEREIREGCKFEFNINGEADEAIWHSLASEVECQAMTHEDCGIVTNDKSAMIGNIPVDVDTVPSMYSVKVIVEVQCNADLWSNENYNASRESYLGFKIHECVRLVFSFGDGTQASDPPHALRTNYDHSLLGFVIRRKANIPGRRTPADRRNKRFVGPKFYELTILVQDDIADTCSGEDRPTLQQVVERWNAKKDAHSFCYVMPLKNESLRQPFFDYMSINMAQRIPKPFKLTLLDPSLAESYEKKRRKLHYNIMRKTTSTHENIFTFPSYEDLKKENMELIRDAVLARDRNLNSEQLDIIQSVLYGYQTRMAPNKKPFLEECSSTVQAFLNNNPDISPVDLAFWGSRFCFIRGPPGTGKTKMLAALIATLLEMVEGRPRILVACETNKALDQIFMKVLSLFDRKSAMYQRVYDKLLRIGSSNLHVVRKKELKGGEVRQVEAAQAVFTTFGSLYRRELQSCDCPFDFFFAEEACLVKNASFITGIVTSRATGPERQRASRGAEVKSKKVVCVAIGDDNQLHAEQFKRRTVPRKLQIHFFDRAWKEAPESNSSTFMSLRQQYRMNPALASFISSQFYRGTLLTPTEGEKGWKDDSKFMLLRQHTLFPARNMCVIDTSPEGARACETMGTGRSFYNAFEVKVVTCLLRAWCHATEDHIFPDKVTVLSSYAKQREELRDSWRTAGLRGISVCTFDEMQGDDNDIIIVSLVRAKQASSQNYSSRSIGFLGNPQRGNVVLSRAKKGVFVIGNASHIAERSATWREFFKVCAAKSSAAEDGTHGYFRLRYVDIDSDLRLAPFLPPYLQQ